MRTLNPHSSVRLPRAEQTRGRVWSRVGLIVIPLLAIAAPVSTASAETTDAPVKVPIVSTQTWTSTGIAVETGEKITINASGVVRFGPAPIDAISPAGKPTSACAALVAREPNRPFPAPKLACWSLLGRIGIEEPIFIGANRTFTATSDGELQVGLNDNRLEDNPGARTVTASVTPGTTGSSDSSSSPLLFVIIGLVVLLVLGALFFLLARRRRNDDDEPLAATVVDAPDDVILTAVPSPIEAEPETVILDEHINEPVDERVDQHEKTRLFAAKVRTPLGRSVAPVEGEIADTNIFEVEITNGTDLRVGYNYFPEDTNLHWQVRQGSIFAHGQFPTDGGGSMYHYVTLPLGVRLESGPAADVQFTWAISGVPFKYSVRRGPGA
jgi:LPXTG-motif cell wall-anchored protein